jgi:hypothetical protein
MTRHTGTRGVVEAIKAIAQIKSPQRLDVAIVIAKPDLRKRVTLRRVLHEVT